MVEVILQNPGLVGERQESPKFEFFVISPEDVVAISNNWIFVKIA